jgi:hypothetical protein
MNETKAARALAAFAERPVADDHKDVTHSVNDAGWHVLECRDCGAAWIAYTRLRPATATAGHAYELADTGEVLLEQVEGPTRGDCEGELDTEGE